MEEVVGKVLFNHITLVSKTNDKIVESLMAVDFHHMPKDRTTADLQHGLRLDLRLLSKASAHAPGENDHFHESARTQCFMRSFRESGGMLFLLIMNISQRSGAAVSSSRCTIKPASSDGDIGVP